MSRFIGTGSYRSQGQECSWTNRFLVNKSLTTPLRSDPDQGIIFGPSLTLHTRSHPLLASSQMVLHRQRRRPSVPTKSLPGPSQSTPFFKTLTTTRRCLPPGLSGGPNQRGATREQTLGGSEDGDGSWWVEGRR